MKRQFLLLSFAAITLLFSSCEKEPKVIGSDAEIPVIDRNYIYTELSLPQPLDFSKIDSELGNITLNGQTINVINSNSLGGIVGGIPIDPNLIKVNITNEGAALGRVLFYDKKLSLNNGISCASCHHQDKAFTDGKAFSTGFEGKITERSSMAILNPITQNNLFWDSRSKSISDLSLRPVINHIEMGMENLDYLEKKLAKESYYKDLFIKAYGTPEITKDKISDALTQFIASITSSNSKFDKVMKGEAEFTHLEKTGMQLFFSNKTQCSACHSGSNFSALDGANDPYGIGGGGDIITDEKGNIIFLPAQDLGGAANIGLDVYPKDQGRGNGSFKIPSLRNIALTAPYMHDGRFATLSDVLDHYSEGIKDHPDLDVKFRESNGSVKKLNLTGAEKAALIAFLNTLTDYTMVNDPKYSNPFVK